MSELDELRDFCSALRQQVRAAQRTMRTAGQMLADFEERLAAFESAQPKEAQRDQHQGNGSRPLAGQRAPS